MDTSAERGSERRQFVRYTLKATADVVFENQSQEQGELDNISTGGMHLRLESEIPRKLQEGKIHASIHAISSEGPVTIEAECSIVRIESDGGVAMFFSSIDSDNRKILRDLVGELNNLLRDNRT